MRTARALAALAPAVVSLAAACAGEPPPAPASPRPVAPSAAAPAKTPPQGAGEEVAREERDVTPAPGIVMRVPAGWRYTLRTDAKAAVFRSPESDLTVSFARVEAPKAADAVALGWQALALGPAAKKERDEGHESVGPWDEVYEVEHETPAASGRVLVTNVRRKGAVCYVTVLDGTRAGFSRRGAQLRQLVFGMKAPGLEEEDLSGAAAAPFDAAKAKAYAEHLDAAREKAHVPGAVVVVLQGGKVVFERALGVREEGKRDAVTPHTLFAIGSVTKSLSSLLLARLVSDGKLRWDSKVKELYPAFQTGDAAFTERLTVADTFCACTGMPRKDMDLLFEYQSVKPERMLAWFSDVKPTTAFGETFQYSNQMTALGGYVAARVARPGAPLDEAYAGALEAMVLAPMGMKESTASFDKAKRGKDRASPHAPSLVKGAEGPSPIPFEMERFVAPVAPAGAVFSNAKDMARYALVELGKGRSPEGKRVFDEAAILERRKPRIKASDRSQYGLGLAVSKLLGLEVVSHDGGTFGFNARFFLVPSKDLGLVVLTNSGDALAFLATAQQRLLELVLGAKETASRDLDRALASDAARREAIHKEIGAPDAALLSELPGVYSEPRLGRVTVTKQGEELVLDVGEWKTRLAYAKASDGTRRVFFLDPPAAGLPLVVESGALVLSFGQDTYRLSRAASPAAR